MNTVAIIGGGFCGTLTAIHLARRSRQPLHIKIVNDVYPLARGVAYSTRRGEHLLNVAARNMSALPDQPNHFVEWLATRAEYADVPGPTLREEFVPRRVYGDYLQSLFLWSVQHAEDEGRGTVEGIAGEAVDVTRDGSQATIHLKDGRQFQAERVLLATGNQAPADLPAACAVAGHRAYCVNPWQGWEERLADRRASVLLIGTGLTMIDAFLTLRGLDWQGTIYAVSRNGLLPLSHFKGIEYPDFPPEDAAHLRLAQLTTLLETHCERLRRQGANPAIVVDKLRPFTQRIWQQFTPEEKEQFLRQYRTRWNVIRHRVAQSIHAELTAAQAGGQLQIVQGDLGAVTAHGDCLHVTVACPAPQGPHTIECGLVINCTGPDDDYAAGKIALFRQLFARGYVQADATRLGLLVGGDFAVIDQAGAPSDWLYAMGQLLKGMLWETTAVPELRIQARLVADAILAGLEQRPVRAAGGFGELYADVLEYCI